MNTPEFGQPEPYATPDSHGRIWTSKCGRYRVRECYLTGATRAVYYAQEFNGVDWEVVGKYSQPPYSGLLPSSATAANGTRRFALGFAGKAGRYLLGTVVLMIFFLGTCVNYGSGPTGRTLYYIDQDGVYYSPPLLANDNRPFAFSMFPDDAIADGFAALDQKIADATDSEALVYANPRTGRWVLRSDPRDHKLLSKVTRDELNEIEGRKPDPVHRDLDGFQDWCGPLEWLLRKVGLAQPRWTEEGDWNW